VVAVVTAPTAAAVAHLNEERRDIPPEGAPQGAESFGESLIAFILLLSALELRWLPIGDADLAVSRGVWKGADTGCVEGEG